LRRIPLLALAVLLAAFVALYPYLGSMGMCDSGECPYVAHSASGGLSTACMVVAVLAVVPALRVAAGSRSYGTAAKLRPLQVNSSPDPPPPRPT
jgi:hypothetical protein